MRAASRRRGRSAGRKPRSLSDPAGSRRGRRTHLEHGSGQPLARAMARPRLLAAAPAPATMAGDSAPSRKAASSPTLPRRRPRAQDGRRLRLALVVGRLEPVVHGTTTSDGPARSGPRARRGRFAGRPGRKPFSAHTGDSAACPCEASGEVGPEDEVRRSCCPTRMMNGAWLTRAVAMLADGVPEAGRRVHSASAGSPRPSSQPVAGPTTSLREREHEAQVVGQPGEKGSWSSPVREARQPAAAEELEGGLPDLRLTSPDLSATSTISAAASPTARPR